MEKQRLLLTKGPRLTKCTFNIKEVKSSSKRKPFVKCKYTVAISKDDTEDTIDIVASIKSNSTNVPFFFEISLQAEFGFSGSAELAEEDIVRQSLPFFYTTMKDLLVELTSKAYMKPFYLPMPYNMSLNGLPELQKE